MSKLLLRDSLYRLYVNTVYLLLKDAKLLLREYFQNRENTVNLLLRDTKLLLRDSTYELCIIQCTSF